MIGGDLPQREPNERLANRLLVERYYQPDRNGMLAALRVILGLPKAPPGWIEELRQ